MIPLVVWAVAYLVVGWFWVRRDQRRHFAQRKGYAYSRRSRWTTRLAWLPMSLVQIVLYAREPDPSKTDLREHLFEDALPANALFAISGGLATWVATR